MEFNSKILETKKCEDEKNCFRIVKFEKPKAFDFKSGQFIMIASEDFKLRDAPEKLKWSSFSIASSPFQKELELCIKIYETKGLTEHLKSKKQGDEIIIKGPFGNFTLNKDFKEVSFVALGTGIAPMISMIRTLLHNGEKKPINLFYGFRNRCCFLYHEELQEMEKNHSNFNLYFVPSDPESDWDVPKGFVQDLIEKNNFSVSKEEVDFFMCGIPKALESIKEFLIKKGFNSEKIFYEKW